MAGQIRAEHEAVGVALRDSVQHAITAGDMLIEAKAQLQHGEWLPWLADHCGLTERTAQRYMRLARNQALLEAKSDTMSDLSLNGALALLTVPRETLDDDLLDSFVDNLDVQEALAKALRSQAEIARRRVVLEQAERNVEALAKILERLGIDRTKPVSEETEKLFAELGFDEPYCNELGAAYEAAVMSDDYDRAFALAEWLHGFTVDMLGMAQAAAADEAEGGP